MNRPRRSAAVTIALVSQVATIALLAGCGDEHRLDAMADGPTQAQVCADKDGVIVTDDMCPKPGATAPSPSTSGGHAGSTIIYPYQWHYYPYMGGSTPTAVGTRVPSNAVRSPQALTSVPSARPNAPGFSGWSSGGFGRSGGGTSSSFSAGSGG